MGFKSSKTKESVYRSVFKSGIKYSKPKLSINDFKRLKKVSFDRDECKSRISFAQPRLVKDIIRPRIRFPPTHQTVSLSHINVTLFLATWTCASPIPGVTTLPLRLTFSSKISSSHDTPIPRDSTFPSLIIK